jgi:type IV secretion/conjugal transfer VirB4 family ATPase
MVDLKKLLKPYKQAGAFNSLLAPHRFIDEYVFLTKGNHLGVVLSAKGIDFECLTGTTLESVTKRAGAAWRAFDERFRIYQYVIKQDRASVEMGGDYSSEPVRKTVAERVDYLNSKREGLYTLQLFYVLMFEPEATNGVLKRTVSNKNALRLLAEDLKRNRATLMAHAQAFQRNLDDPLGLSIAPKQASFSFFRLLANLDPDVAAAERLKHDQHIDYYVASSPLVCTSNGIQLGEAQVEVLSLKEPPSATFPNVLRDLLAIKANFILCTEYKRLANEKAVAIVRAAQSHFHWSQWVSDLPSILSMVLNRGNRENVIADKSALNDVEDLDKTLSRINNDGEYLGEFSFTAVLFGWGGRDALRAAAGDVVKILGHHEGSLIGETYNALNAYLSIIPGNQVLNLRRTWLLSANYADLSFLYAPAVGEKTNLYLRSEYLVVLETNMGTPYYFNLHEEERFGALIFGAPRMGKSVTANLLIDHAQKYSPRTFILDLGGSYQNITRKYDGSYTHMQLGEGRQSFRINPFVLENTNENLQFLFSFVSILLTNSGYTVTAADERELFEAVEGMYVLDPENRTLTNLALGLPPHMKPYLHAWIGAGQYGSIFDNREDTLTFSHFQAFDFRGIDEQYPKVLEPLLFYVFQRISQVVYDPTLRRTPKQLWTDETWRFLANGRAKDFLLAAGATWGKHNGGIGLITQSAAHFHNAGVLGLINELCPTKILLPNPGALLRPVTGADQPSYQEMFQMNEKELEMFSTLLPRRQLLVKRSDHSSVVLNINLDPKAIWLHSNSAYSNEERAAAIEQHGFEKGMQVLAGLAS